jgi:hypothetical protein
MRGFKEGTTGNNQSFYGKKKARNATRRIALTKKTKCSVIEIDATRDLARVAVRMASKERDQRLEWETV